MKNRVVVTVAENGNVQVITNDSTMDAIIVDYRLDKAPESEFWNDPDNTDCSMMVDTCTDALHVANTFSEFAAQTADKHGITGFKKWMEAYGIEDNDLLDTIDPSREHTTNFDHYLEELLKKTPAREIKDQLVAAFCLKEI